jgi:hypothetical protein
LDCPRCSSLVTTELTKETGPTQPKAITIKKDSSWKIQKTWKYTKTKTCNKTKQKKTQDPKTSNETSS